LDDTLILVLPYDIDHSRNLRRNGKLFRVTPDLPADLTEIRHQVPSTAGMTTKVVKGSLWTLAGHVAPLFATLATTPFVIRLLGSEAYGVLLLVGLIPNYFSFADFGMGIASTKFASEAYGQGNARREGEIVRTATLIAFICSAAVAVPMFVFSGIIIGALNVPEHLYGQAVMALRLTSISFVIAILSGVLNTPQLSRLRMDLNATINASGRVLLAAGTVLILYLGGGIAGAAFFGLAITTLGLIAHILVSGRLLRDLFGLSFDRAMIRPLVIFGGGLLFSGIAAMLLINLEKLLLTRMISVRSLAYYSVAFTFANMAVLFSWAMVQSLIPAFSQLLSPDKKNEFDALFSRCIRISLVGLLPAMLFLFVIARPFLTIWAGEDFGRESTLPFFVLQVGLLFNVIAYVPYAALVASGHTKEIAKLHWLELLPYAVLAVVLINYFGIIGAAMAWSSRVIVDAGLFTWLAHRFHGVSSDVAGRLPALLTAVLILVPPAIFAAFYDNFSLWLVPMILVCTALYFVLIWKRFVVEEEKAWVRNRLAYSLRRT
jgi:O-antigen/teichoic acid export membrane protein